MEAKEEQSFQNRVDLSQLAESVEQIRKNIGSWIVGQERMVDLIITAILADGHVLLEGVPGVAKTLTAKLVAKTVSVGFSRIQFTPDLMPSDVLGTSVFNAKTTEFEYRKGPVFSNIILVDEINRAPAKTQASLFEVMEERQITTDLQTFQMEEPFLVLATQNPIEQEGTYRLPEAQLDRFLFKIEVDYPSLEEETMMLERFHRRHHRQDLSEVASVISAEQLKQYREKIGNIHIEDHLIRYIAAIVNESRQTKALYLGASPRASLAIMATAKAYAAIHGRDFVTPEDIKSMAAPVMVHRVILTPEAEMEGLKVNTVLKQMVDKVEVPR
ncbi:MoxR family ATPase [Porifericola rhodea]|uniref:AAA family ATPase n=1 Tax=Porifericola rhodea TaxID=930972 RepID=UPI0026655EFE|nr:MoxR family ATPase [Porifericola rhodea]WKN33150.1 MoxR family ATPase [Porifericola rhodea]